MIILAHERPLLLNPKITVERRREMVKLPEIQGERSQIVVGDYDGDCRRSISEEIGRRSRRATVIFGLKQRPSEIIGAPHSALY